MTSRLHSGIMSSEKLNNGQRGDCVGQYEFDYSKLLGTIKEHGMTAGEFAKKIRVNPCTFSQKISSKAFFKQQEIMAAVKLLEIEKNKIGEYFFKEKVHKN